MIPFSTFKKLTKLLQNENCNKICKIKSDREFQNENFNSFCEKNGIQHKFSAPKTLQQNREV